VIDGFIRVPLEKRLLSVPLNAINRVVDACRYMSTIRRDDG